MGGFPPAYPRVGVEVVVEGNDLLHAGQEHPDEALLGEGAVPGEEGEGGGGGGQEGKVEEEER